MYININYIITIIDRTFILIIVKIRKIIIKITIRKLRFKIYYSNKFIIFIFYIKEVFFNNNDIRIFAKIIREIYIIDNFKINMLIDIDIFILKRIIIDFIV